MARDPTTGGRGRRPRPSTVAALRRQEQKEARALVRQRQALAVAPPRPVRGEDPATKAVRPPATVDPRATERAPVERTTRALTRRKESLYPGPPRGVDVGGLARGVAGYVGGTAESLARGAAWSVTHPRQRLTGDIPEEFLSIDPETGLAMSSMEFPWGPTGRFLRGRRGKPVAPAPEPPVPGAEKVVESLGEAKRLRLQQEKLYRAERGKRIGEADALAKAIGGIEGHRAALEALKGELPKLRFGGLEGAFDETTVTTLFKHVNEHPQLRKFERVRARQGLIEVLRGKVPTRSEIRLFEKAFGPDTAADLQASAPFFKKAYNTGLEIINVPRSLKSSFDISAPFRQGLVLGARHPAMWAREWGPMLKAFKSERAYEDIMEDIASRPTFEAMQRARLAITDLGGLGTREEAFMSNLAEIVPGVRASGRAYTGFLNKFRADAFDNYLQIAEAQGRDITDEALLKSISSWVNHATGRGSLKNFEAAMKPMNAVFFSPRLIASRLQLLNPAYYARLDPFARQQALRGMAQLTGAVSLTLYMAKFAGADVGIDPRSADFGKIKVGDTRVDIAGGFQQYLVVAARLVRGETVSSTTGEVQRLEGGFAKPSRADIAQRFGEQKFAPVPGFVRDWAKNENFAGEEFDPAREGIRSFAPFGVESIYDTRSEGAAPAIATGVLGSVGFGLQTYESKPAAPKPPGTEAEKVAASIKTEEKVARQVGVRMPSQVRDAIRLRERLAAAVDRLHEGQKERGDVATPAGKQFKLTARQKAAAELRVLSTVPAVRPHAARLKTILDNLKTDRQIESFRNQLKDELGLGVLEQWHEETAEAMEERALAVLDVPVGE
jgi:hypothetical protein